MGVLGIECGTFFIIIYYYSFLSKVDLLSFIGVLSDC